MNISLLPARLGRCVAILGLSVVASPALPAMQSLSLAGERRFALDRHDVGVQETWLTRDLPDRIQLPGVLQSQGYGDEISTNTPWALSLYDHHWLLREDYKPCTKPGQAEVPFLCQPLRHYLGAAWFDNRIMHKLEAMATTTDGDASAAIDGDPNTDWLVGVPARGMQAVPHPPSLTIRFPNPVPMTGVVLMNRQNDRNRQGDIRGYTLAVSNDGRSWRAISSGELASTWNPQRILFPHPVTARHLRLTAHSGFGSDPSTALAELAVLSAGDDQTTTGANPLKFKRVRSTSTDVDEGN